MKKLAAILGTLIFFSFHPALLKTFVPPGTVQITDHLFADKTEISNESWLEFEYWTRVKYGYHSKEHLETLPDTLVWRNGESQNEPYVTYYYRHPAYREFPVVGVSYQQALAFCKWRSERVKEYYAIAHKKEVFVEYTLPSKQEWEFISMNGSFVLSKGGKDNKNHAMLNCARDKRDSLIIDKRVVNGKYPDVTTPVNSYKPNQFGLFNCLGNVAEMVLEEGISKGGGWLHASDECRVGNDIPYTKANAWLGFRCVCKIGKYN